MSDRPDNRDQDEMNLARLRADIQAGFNQLTRSEGRTYDEESGRRLIEDIKARARAKLAANREATTKD